MDLGLDVIDGIGRLHLKGDRLPREGLDENLHLLEDEERGWRTAETMSSPWDSWWLRGREGGNGSLVLYS